MPSTDADIVKQSKSQLITGLLFLLAAGVNTVVTEEGAVLSSDAAVLWALVGSMGVLIYASERIRRWLSRLVGSPSLTLIVSGVCFGLAYAAFRIDVQSAAVILAIFGASVIISFSVIRLKKTWRNLRAS